MAPSVNRKELIQDMYCTLAKIYFSHISATVLLQMRFNPGEPVCYPETRYLVWTMSRGLNHLMVIINRWLNNQYTIYYSLRHLMQYHEQCRQGKRRNKVTWYKCLAGWNIRNLFPDSPGLKTKWLDWMIHSPISSGSWKSLCCCPVWRIIYQCVFAHFLLVYKFYQKGTISHQMLLDIGKIKTVQ